MKICILAKKNKPYVKEIIYLTKKHFHNTEVYLGINGDPNKFKYELKVKLKNYNLLFLSFKASEKNKSINVINYYLNILLSKNFNRSDLIIAVGGGITGDVVGFISSIFKRGINFINIPTTLLAQVDSAIGGKNGVNSEYGKNLIGSFYQPKLVVSDTSFINSFFFLSKIDLVFFFNQLKKILSFIIECFKISA